MAAQGIQVLHKPLNFKALLDTVAKLVNPLHHDLADTARAPAHAPL